MNKKNIIRKWKRRAKNWQSDFNDAEIRIQSLREQADVASRESLRLGELLRRETRRVDMLAKDVDSRGRDLTAIKVEIDRLMAGCADSLPTEHVKLTPAQWCLRWTMLGRGERLALAKDILDRTIIVDCSEDWGHTALIAHLQSEISRLRAGEADFLTDENSKEYVRPFPADQWIRWWNEQDGDKRLEVAKGIERMGNEANECFIGNHVSRIEGLQASNSHSLRQVTALQAELNHLGKAFEAYIAEHPDEVPPQQEYPRMEGDFLVIGPGCFANSVEDPITINFNGVNFHREETV